MSARSETLTARQQEILDFVRATVESEGRPPTRAEVCDECKSYLKIFYQDKDLHVEPVADDLASLMLDVLVGEAGYSRASGNPLLWHGSEGSSESEGPED